jgi:hypothetical protein
VEVFSELVHPAAIIASSTANMLNSNNALGEELARQVVALMSIAVAIIVEATQRVCVCCASCLILSAAQTSSSATNVTKLATALHPRLSSSQRTSVAAACGSLIQHASSTKVVRACTDHLLLDGHTPQARNVLSNLLNEMEAGRRRVRSCVLVRCIESGVAGLADRARALVGQLDEEEDEEEEGEEEERADDRDNHKNVYAAMQTLANTRASVREACRTQRPILYRMATTPASSTPPPSR